MISYEMPRMANEFSESYHLVQQALHEKGDKRRACYATNENRVVVDRQDPINRHASPNYCPDDGGKIDAVKVCGQKLTQFFNYAFKNYFTQMGCIEAPRQCRHFGEQDYEAKLLQLFNKVVEGQLIDIDSQQYSLIRTYLLEPNLTNFRHAELAMREVAILEKTAKSHVADVVILCNELERIICFHLIEQTPVTVYYDNDKLIQFLG